MRYYWGTSPIGSRRTKPPINTPDAGVTGAEGPRGHGQASRSTTPSLQPRVWRSRGRPGPTVPRKPAAPQAPPRRSDGGRAERRPKQRGGHCTRYGALHPLRGATPVMGRCTRSEGVHCLQIGCSAPNHKNKRGICETTAGTHKTRPPELAQFDEVLRRRECHTHKAPGARAPGASTVTPQTAATSQTGARAPGASAQQQLSQRSTSRRRGRPRR